MQTAYRTAFWPSSDGRKLLFTLDGTSCTAENVSQDDDLLDVRSHFAFGDNWASYSKGIGERQVAEAIEGLRRLCGDEVAGRRFLDIGCGSGIHSLSALELGANEVTAVDLDVRSVETTRTLLGNSIKSGKWTVDVCSVFEVGTKYPQELDIVYSWGVLHHTGNLDRAMREAAQRVKKSGLFCFALYRQTWLCPLWKLKNASIPLQVRVARIWRKGSTRLCSLAD